MINRVILLVIDGLGVGAMPDAADYHDAGANTVVHLADAVDGLSLPNMEMLGLGHVAPIKGVRTMAQPTGSFGRLGFLSAGKDSVIGYWESSGVIHGSGGALYASGIPPQVMSKLEEALGRKVIEQRAAPIMTIFVECGDDHLHSGAPIAWTDGGRTCHIAVHEKVMPADEFYQRCRDARKAFKDTDGPVRIVGHRFTVEAGAWKMNGRKDMVSEPPGLTMLDVLNRSSQITMGVGKVYDLFSGRGFTKAFPALTAAAAFDETIRMMSKLPRGLLYVSLNLMPDDSPAAATALQAFDRRLPDLFNNLRVGDLVMITSDHGRDLSRPGKMPTREYVPVLVTGPKLAHGVNLGTRVTAADLGQTVVDALRAERLPVGDSFFEALRQG